MGTQFLFFKLQTTYFYNKRIKSYDTGRCILGDYRTRGVTDMECDSDNSHFFESRWSINQPVVRSVSFPELLRNNISYITHNFSGLPLQHVVPNQHNRGSSNSCLSSSRISNGVRGRLQWRPGHTGALQWT